SREAPSSGRVPLEDVRVDRRDQGAIPRPRDSAPTEGRPTRAEAAQAVRPRLARWADSGVRLDERRLDEESGEELLGPARLARDALPLLEHLAILRFESDEHVPHLPTQLVRLLSLEDDGQVCQARLLDDQRIRPVDDRTERFPPKDRERGPHEILDDIERRPEEVLVNRRLPRLSLRADEGAAVDGQEDGLDRIPTRLEHANRD